MSATKFFMHLNNMVAKSHGSVKILDTVDACNGPRENVTWHAIIRSTCVFPFFILSSLVFVRHPVEEQTRTGTQKLPFEGSGKTKQRARDQAAYSALTYFNIDVSQLHD
jgi:hypothetical protein